MYWHLFTHVLCQVPGTKNNHCFIPVNNEQLKIFRVSSDNVGTLTGTTQPNETPHDAVMHHFTFPESTSLSCTIRHGTREILCSLTSKHKMSKLTSWQPREHMVHSSGPGKKMNAGCPQSTYCVLCQHRPQHQLDDNIVLMSQPLQIQNYYFSSLLKYTFLNYVN